MTFSLENLNRRVAERSSASPDESYTARLLRDGVDRCARKFGEEAVELIVSAVSRDRQGLTSEAADVPGSTRLPLEGCGHATGVPSGATVGCRLSLAGAHLTAGSARWRTSAPGLSPGGGRP